METHGKSKQQALLGRYQEYFKDYQGKAYWYYAWVITYLLLQAIFTYAVTDVNMNVNFNLALKSFDTFLRLVVMPQIDKESYFNDLWSQVLNLAEIVGQFSP